MKKEAKEKKELEAKIEKFKNRKIEGGIVKINFASFNGNIQKMEEDIGALEELEAEIMTYLYEEGFTAETATELNPASAEKDENNENEIAPSRKVKPNISLEDQKQLEDKLKKIEKDRKVLIAKKGKYEKSLETNASFGYNNLAFVTFNSEKIKDDYLKAAQNDYGWLYRLYKSFQHMFCRSKKPFKITRAPEPEDIKWKNIGFSSSSRIRTFWFSALVMNLVLFVSLIFQFYIKVWEKAIVGKYQNSDKWFHIQGIRGLNILTSVLITVINSILTFLATKLSKLELHISKTGFYTSHTKAIVKAQIVNTGFVTFLLYYLPTFRSKFGGFTVMSQTLFSIFTTNLLLTPIMSILNPGYLYGKIWK